MSSTLETLQTLTNHGWVQQETARCFEKVGKKATTSFGYDTPAGEQLDLYYYEGETSINFRIYNQKQRDSKWFGFPINDQLVGLLKTITEQQDEIKTEDYFSFYFGIQNACEGASILAWEQWEDNYS